MYKPGEIVSCQIQECASGGYVVRILPEGHTGFLKSTKIWPISKKLDVAFVIEQGHTLLFTENQSSAIAGKTMAEVIGLGNANLPHVTGSYFAELAERCGIDEEKVKELTFAEVLELANSVAMGLELTDLCGSFKDNLLAVLKVWQHLSDSEIAMAASSDDFLSSLKEQRLVSPEQFETIKKGQALVASGALTFQQFAVAYRDGLDGDLTFDQSLKLRNWLPAERLESSV